MRHPGEGPGSSAVGVSLSRMSRTLSSCHSRGSSHPATPQTIGKKVAPLGAPQWVDRVAQSWRNGVTDLARFAIREGIVEP